MIKYSKTSPYSSTSQASGYLDVISWKDIPSLANDVEWEVTTQYTHRPDLLAYDVYQDSSLWWVFASRNKDVLRDPIYDMVPGQKIFIPQVATVKKVLGL